MSLVQSGGDLLIRSDDGSRSKSLLTIPIIFMKRANGSSRYFVRFFLSCFPLLDTWLGGSKNVPLNRQKQCAIISQKPSSINRGRNAPFKSDVVFVTFGAFDLFPITSFESQSTFDILFS